MEGWGCSTPPPPVLHQPKKPGADRVKDTWKILNTAMGWKSKTTNINSLQVGSETFSEPGEIAKKLNYHFGSVARKILAEAPTNTSKPEGSINPHYYLCFIPKKKEPFKFKEITPEQIIKCVSKMKNSKSGKIPTMFVKDTIEVTAPILSVIFNKSTRKGVFPKKPHNRKNMSSI